jgi:hypothetical protein
MAIKSQEHSSSAVRDSMPPKKAAPKARYVWSCEKEQEVVDFTKFLVKEGDRLARKDENKLDGKFFVITS